MRERNRLLAFLLVFSFIALLVDGCGSDSGAASATGGNTKVSADIRAVFDKPMYKKSLWGLRVIDRGSGKILINLRPKHQFFIGSVRKVFTIGELMNQIGPDHTYNTPVFRQGTVDSSGVMNGNLILVASGDLTMGGRTNPDGTIAFSNYDHNEADSLGNAVLTAPDPLAGYKMLAGQVAAAGIKQITGEVIIDDRLFQPFNFREQFDVTPIFVNDDMVDLTINPTTAGSLASVVWRPVSAALGVNNTLVTGAAGSKYTVSLNPQLPQCIGQAGCTAEITGQLPIDFVPPLTSAYPLVQTFRIVKPSNYARTVFIEALEAAGVTVNAAPVEVNPTQLLPAQGSYAPDTQVAQLTGLPYSEDAKLIMKVSYNIGADTSLVLWGLTQGVNNMSAALQAEQQNLTSHFGITPNEYRFFDGSGGGATTASNVAVTKMLTDMAATSVFQAYRNSFPILGVDGSLGFVKDFQSDPTLAGATGQVLAKTGTDAVGSKNGLVLKGQALGGYINAKSGRELVFQLVVNNVPLTGIGGVIQVFQDEGTIAATLWRDN